MADKPPEIEDFDMEATEGFELVRIDEGAYDAELTKLVKIPNVKVVREGKEIITDMLRWTFTTPDGIEVGGTSSTKFSTKSKARAWAQKLLGREIPDGETLKPKDLAGKPCQIMVKDKKKVREFQGQKQELVVSQVMDVLSVKKAAPEKAAKGKK